ncbi:MAG: lactate racemase, partial [Thermoproteota archaeon]|nr:lactate racemase [Thermoproteota archaeon]
MEKIFDTTFAGVPMQVKIPKENLINVIEPHEQPSLKDPVKMLKEILDNPVGCEKLIDMVKPGDKVAIASSEYMRYPYTWILAPVVVDVLKKAGVKDENICL